MSPPSRHPVPELPAGYELREVERFDDDVLKGLVARNLSSGSGVIQTRRLHPPGRREELEGRRAGLHPEPVCLRFGVWREEELVAWSFSRAESPRTLVMMTSGVEAAHRRRGLYTVLLRTVTRRAEALGFEVIKSYHSASNRPILVAKLRDGWYVTGVHVEVAVGQLVVLERFLYPELEAAFHLRTGWRPPTTDQLHLFGEEPS